uniref:CRAL-TRIO domain-containing protein n=1 Tax=Ciona savignyi TaxID=51511 RepID=H2ZI22_CIOSA
MNERYECKLTTAELKKAVDELKEPLDNSERLAAIDDFRQAIHNHSSNTKLLDESDSFLLRFLRSKKFNQEKALNKLISYHESYETWNEVFDKVRSPVLIRPLIEAGVILPLEGLAKDGSRVVVGRPGIIDHSWTDMMAMIILTVETLLKEEHSQIYGLTVIVDQAYFSMELAKQYTPTVAKKWGNFMQNAFPGRLKMMNITNQGKVFDIIFTIAQQFMKEKMKQRFQFHGTEFSTLYDVVDKSVLPPMFAGGGPELDPEYWKSHLVSEDTAL